MAKTKYRIITAHSVSGTYGFVVEKYYWFWGWCSISHVLFTEADALACLDEASQPDGVVVYEAKA